MRTSIAAQAGFRGDFFLGLIVSTIWLLAYVTVIATIFYNSTTVAGWSKGEVVIIFGLFEVLDGLIAMFVWRNIESFAALIRDGSMDFILTKPLDSQFHISFRRFSFNDIGVFGSGVVALLYGFSHLIYRPDLVHVIATMLLLICGAVLYYSMAMLVETCSFWFIRLENLPVLIDVTYVVARYPLNVFEGVMRRIVFYVIPLAFFATVPAMVLLGRVTMLPWIAASISLACVFLTASRLFWLYGIKNYSSASS